MAPNWSCNVVSARLSTLVSICIPTYNGERWLAEAISSALEQTYPSLEILIVDDASLDRTLDIVHSFRDPRIRVEVNSKNLGIVRNRNRCVTLARGAFVKFLFQDDMLYPTCIERMSQILESHERAGMVFAPRDMLLENPDEASSVAFKEHYGSLYHEYAPLCEINSGIDLFKKGLRTGFLENWIGEPSNVLLRRSSFGEIGLFNEKLKSCSDWEMWVRIMYHFDVGFVNEPLSSFRIHSSSAGHYMERHNLVWLDRVWLLEGLLEDKEISRNYPEIKQIRDETVRTAIGDMYNSPSKCYMLKSFTDYCVYRLCRTINCEASIHGCLEN